MKTHYESMDEAFEAMVNFVNEDEDHNEMPELFFTARPSSRVDDADIDLSSL